MCNNATAVLRDCEVCRVSRIPSTENAPHTPLLQQLRCVPFPLGRFDGRTLHAPLWIVLRDCEVCEFFYIPLQETRGKCIYIGRCGAAIANLAVPPTPRTRVGGPPWVIPSRVISTALFRQGVALVHRQPTAPQQVQDLADDDLDIDDSGIDEMLEDAMDWLRQRSLPDEGEGGRNSTKEKHD